MTLGQGRESCPGTGDGYVSWPLAFFSLFGTSILEARGKKQEARKTFAALSAATLFLASRLSGKLAPGMSLGF